MSNILISDLSRNSETSLVDLSCKELSLKGGFFGRLFRGIGRGIGGVAKVAAPMV